MLRRVAIGAGACGAAYAAYTCTRHGELYTTFKQPLFKVIDGETGHKLAVAVTSRPWLVRAAGFADPSPADPPSLRTKVWGLEFANPLGSAAGYDKDAQSIDGLAEMGFGLVEIGSVTPQPQPGNAKPRVFRLLEDGAVINRYGFNSAGMAVVRERLERWAASRASATPRAQAVVLGVNLGKNKQTADAASDYELGMAALGEHAAFVVVNVSSPNTPGLRDLQAREQLEALLRRAVAARDRLGRSPPPPLLVKIAPDLSDAELTDVAHAATAARVDGVVVSNTTLARPESLRSEHKGETGGLSGRPLTEPSTEVLRRLYALTKGELPLVGVGGIGSGADAYAKVRAGASLLQLYTALALEGPPVVWRVKAELAALLERDGFASVADAVGADHRAK